MKQWFQKLIVERWWIWVFLIFIIFIFRLGEKDNNQEKNAPEVAEKTVVSVGEKEKIDMSEYKQIHTEEELNETLKIS